MLAAAVLTRIFFPQWFVYAAIAFGATAFGGFRNATTSPLPTLTSDPGPFDFPAARLRSPGDLPPSRADGSATAGDPSAADHAASRGRVAHAHQG